MGGGSTARRAWAGAIIKVGGCLAHDRIEHRLVRVTRRAGKAARQPSQHPVTTRGQLGRDGPAAETAPPPPVYLERGERLGSKIQPWGHAPGQAASPALRLP